MEVKSIDKIEFSGVLWAENRPGIPEFCETVIFRIANTQNQLYSFCTIIRKVIIGYSVDL